MVIALVIIGVLILAGITIFAVVAGRSRSATGGLSRETRKRDQSAPAPQDAELSTSTELEAAGRERSDETRGAFLEKSGSRTPVEWEPVDEEELGVTRRQFLNRGLLTAVGFGLAAFAPAMLAFLWPFGSSGFGSKVKVDKSIDDVKAYVAQNRQPYYVPLARTYLEVYPVTDLDKAKKIYKPIVISGMEKGLVALYQRCVHLGCRVPFCQSSQWFECPCHGSKYNRVGEKKAGPAPRGLDHWPMVFSGSEITIDTSGSPIIGPPIGTNTTGQEPEGPLCV